jgi:Domain of unknown function (DUF4157)
MTASKAKPVEKAKASDTAPAHAVSRRTVSACAPSGPAFGDEQYAAGNLAIQRWTRSRAIQAKLTIGQPGDAYEQEADYLAELVIRSTPIPRIQRNCAACVAGTPCLRREETAVQAKVSVDLTPYLSSAAESSLASLRGGGQPMSTSARAFFEPRFGADFSAVRIHTGAKAEESARMLGARAFTVGRDVVFGAGEYSADSETGGTLLAHELVHVLQQDAAESHTTNHSAQADPADTNKSSSEESNKNSSLLQVPHSNTAGRHQVRRLNENSIQRQFGLWGTRPDLPKTSPTPTDMTARVATLKDQKRMELNLETAYIQRGKGGMEGLIAEIEQELDQFAPKDKPDVQAVIKLIRDRILAYHDQYVGTFAYTMRATIDDMLTASENALEEERKKYGIYQESEMKDGAVHFKDRYGVKGTNDTNELAKAAKHLQDVGTLLFNKQIEFQNKYRKEHERGPGQDARLSEEGQRAMLSNPEFVVRIQEYEQLFREYSAKFPILAAFKDNPHGIAAMAAMGRSPDAATVVGKTLQDKQDNIDETRDNLKQGKLQVWSLPNVVTGTKVRMKVKPETLENRFVDDTVAEIKTEEEMRQRALQALTIAAGIIAAVATGGGSLVLGAGATGFGLGLSSAQALQNIQNYQVQSAAAGTDLDRARSISQEDPSLFWLAVDIALVIADLVQAAALFKGAAGPIRKFLTLRRNMEAAHGAEKTGIALAGEEAAQLNNVLADEVEPALSGLPNETKAKIKGDLDPTGRLPAAARGTTSGAKWTIQELDQILKNTPQGLKALAVKRRYKIEIVYSTEGKTYFDGKIIFIASDMTNEQAAVGYIHEMTHAEYQHEGLTAGLLKAGTQIDRQQYIERMCREEAEAIGNQIAHRFEYQAKSGRAYPATSEAEKAAEKAYSKAAIEEAGGVLAANVNADPGIVRMRSSIAGREAVYREIMDPNSLITNVLTGERYPVYYGDMYDAQRLPSFPLPP